MKRFFILLIIVLLSMSSGCISIPGDIKNSVENPIATKTGYVEDINFNDGSWYVPNTYTCVRFADQDVIFFRNWEISIPLHQNVTLHYHPHRTFGHLINVTVLNEEKDE